MLDKATTLDKVLFLSVCILVGVSLAGTIWVAMCR